MSQFLFPAPEDASLSLFWLRDRIHRRAFPRDGQLHFTIALTRAVLAQRQLQEGRRLLQERDRQRHLFAGVSQHLHLRGSDTKNTKIKGRAAAPQTASYGERKGSWLYASRRHN